MKEELAELAYIHEDVLKELGRVKQELTEALIKIDILNQSNEKLTLKVDQLEYEV